MGWGHGVSKGGEDEVNKDEAYDVELYVRLYKEEEDSAVYKEDEDDVNKEVGEDDVNKEDEDDVNKEEDDETGMEKSSAGVAAPWRRACA